MFELFEPLDMAFALAIFQTGWYIGKRIGYAIA